MKFRNATKFHRKSGEAEIAVRTCEFFTAHVQWSQIVPFQ